LLLSIADLQRGGLTFSEKALFCVNIVHIKASEAQLEGVLHYSNPYSKIFTTDARKQNTIIQNHIETHFDIWHPTVENSCNVEILQRYQSKILRIVTNASWYVTSDTLHPDLKIPTIKQTIKEFCQRYRDRLKVHSNNESRRRNSEKTQEEETHRSIKLIFDSQRLNNVLVRLRI